MFFRNVIAVTYIIKYEFSFSYFSFYFFDTLVFCGYNILVRWMKTPLSILLPKTRFPTEVQSGFIIYIKVV